MIHYINTTFTILESQPQIKWSSNWSPTPYADRERLCTLFMIYVYMCMYAHFWLICHIHNIGIAGFSRAIYCWQLCFCTTWISPHPHGESCWGNPIPHTNAYFMDIFSSPRTLRPWPSHLLSIIKSALPVTNLRLPCRRRWAYSSNEIWTLRAGLPLEVFCRTFLVLTWNCFDNWFIPTNHQALSKAIMTH